MVALLCLLFIRAIPARQRTSSDCPRRLVQTGIEGNLFAGGRYRLGLRRSGFAGDPGDDLFSVEAAVLDENFAGVQSSEQHSRHVHSRNVRFVSHGIAGRLASLRVELNALSLEKREIGMVAGERKHLFGRNRRFALAVVYPKFAGLDAMTRVLNKRANFPALMRLSMSGFTQYFRLFPTVGPR